jgi:fumarate reductase subunit D
MSEDTSDASVVQAWKNREEQALGRLTRDLNWYVRWSSYNRWLARSLAMIVLICAVLAPVTVASTGEAGIRVFGISAERVSQLALMVTLVLAFAEGLRRTYRFDQRYATCLNARDELGVIHENYLDSQVGKQIGGDEWINNLTALRKRMHELLRKDNEEFMQIIKGEATK